MAQSLSFHESFSTQLEVIGEFYLHDFVIAQIKKEVFHGLIDKGA